MLSATFTAVELCLLSTHENKAGRAYKWEHHLLFLPSPSTSFCWMMLSRNRISSTTKRCKPFAGAQPPHAHRAQGIQATSFKTSQLFHELCRLFALPASLTFMHTEHCHCHFRNPLVAAGRFPPAGTRSPRRGAGISLPRCKGFANQVTSSALHHSCVYIRLCGSLQTNRHLNCIKFVFSVLSQLQKLLSFSSATAFVFTYSTEGAQWTLLQREN